MGFVYIVALICFNLAALTGRRIEERRFTQGVALG